MKIIYLILLSIILIPATHLFSEDYVDFIRSANQLYKNEEYQKAAESYEKAIATGNASVNDFYNCACCWSLVNNKKKAIENLEKAVEAGFLEEEWLMSDSDFENIRDEEEFHQIVEKVMQNKEKIIDGLPEEHKFIKTLDLPEPQKEGKMSVEESLQNRRSVRRYKDEPITLEELSQVLWAAYGLTREIDGGPEFLRGGLRAAPSAGALYPLDIYVVASNVTGLDTNGIYFYNSQHHTLSLIKSGDYSEKLIDAAGGQMFVGQAPATLVYSAIYNRTTKKYGKRGRERYVCMDLGHSGQNVYLQCTALGLGTCAVGAFSDLKLRALINMTRHEEPLYIMPIGKLND